MDSQRGRREENKGKRDLNLKQIGQSFKSEWVISKLIPKCNEFINKEKLGYLHRLAALNTLKVRQMELSLFFLCLTKIKLYIVC